MLEQVKADINRSFPDFNLSEVRFIGEGLDSRAILVNKKYVFRFPKFEDSARQLEVEIKILPELSGKLDLNIPNFEYVGRQANGLPFVGYRIIEGEFLTSELVRSLNSEQRKQVSKQLANLLQSIHDYPVELADDMGVATQDIKDDCQQDLATIRSKVYQLLDRRSQEYIERLYSDFFLIQCILNTKKSYVILI